MLYFIRIRRSITNGANNNLRRLSLVEANMPFGETKVYFDGSHYIAIPHTERPQRYRPKPIEEVITVAEAKKEGSDTDKATEPLISCESDEGEVDKKVIAESQNEPLEVNAQPLRECQMTRKELFEELYQKYIDLPKKERHYKIMDGMEAYFDSIEQLKWYVDLGFERKHKNLVYRRIRMVRKARLAHFNYFCTFTYSNEKHTEESFKKGLRTCFRNLCNRKGWKYMGVWERSPEKQRLHFHGLFYIPENAMVGELFEKTDYDLRNHRMRTTVQNTFFNEKYGRSDFEEILPIENNLERELSYLMKYIEKTGEKIVYSKGLYQYFISDIMDEDIVSTIGQEDKKLLLFDDFNCWDEGLYMGKVSPEVIAQMRKSN